MKKMRNLLALAIIGSVIFVSCNGDDTTKPVVTLKGASDTTIVLNSTWTDPGATAEDDKDGEITDIQVTGTVLKDLTGTYVLTYSATDAAGNTGSATRTVRVRNTAERWAGNYSVTDVVVGQGSNTYPDIITFSQTENRMVWVTKFAYYTNGAVKFYFENPESNTTNVILPLQEDIHCGTPPLDADRDFSGTGKATSATSFYINYTEITNNTPAQGTETYTKQ